MSSVNECEQWDIVGTERACNNCRLSTPLKRIGLFLSELALKDVDEKVQFFSHLQNLSSTVPPQFSKHKLIPELLKIMVRLSCCPSQNCDI